MTVRFIKTKSGARGFGVSFRGNVKVDGYALPYFAAGHFVLASDRIPRTDKGPPFHGAVDRATVSAMLNAPVDDVAFETTGAILRSACEAADRHFDGHDGPQAIAFVDEAYVVDARAVAMFAAFLGPAARVIMRRMEHEGMRCVRFDAPRARLFLALLDGEAEVVIGGQVTDHDDEAYVDVMRVGTDRAYALQFVRDVMRVVLSDAGANDPAIRVVPPAHSFQRGAIVIGEKDDGANAAMGLREASRACEIHGFTWAEIDGAANTRGQA